VVGKEYGASGKYRWLWGGDYRRLWTEPIQVEVLDLQTFAGALTPVMRVGGQKLRAWPCGGRMAVTTSFTFGFGHKRGPLI